VYLKHLLLEDGTIAVNDDVTKQIAFYETEERIEFLIAAGRIRVVKRRKVKGLYWIGPPLAIKPGVPQPAAPAEEFPGGRDIRSRVRYSHNHETRENPTNVWTLIPLADFMQPIFLAAVTECGGTREA
jgi:hypothetical protein